MKKRMTIQWVMATIGNSLYHQFHKKQPLSLIHIEGLAFSEKHINKCNNRKKKLL